MAPKKFEETVQVGKTQQSVVYSNDRIGTTIYLTFASPALVRGLPWHVSEYYTLNGEERATQQLKSIPKAEEGIRSANLHGIMPTPTYQTSCPTERVLHVI